MYNKTPQNTPRNIYPRIIPLLYTNMGYRIVPPANIQKAISSRAVKIFPAEKLLLSILKKSNNTPTITPSNAKIKNNPAWAFAILIAHVGFNS